MFIEMHAICVAYANVLRMGLKFGQHRYGKGVVLGGEAYVHTLRVNERNAYAHTDTHSKTQNPVIGKYVSPILFRLKYIIYTRYIDICT